ncbi:MAG: alpha-N-acetylglucosaminidase, partial [bacterium]|nr:alpha-N-acetylglucosaminidase [bacterium]
RFYGSDHLYNADCFNEINPPTDSPEFIAAVGKSVYNAMTAADPKAIWVFQGWFFYFQADFWKAPQASALLNAVPQNGMMGLDLYCETQPVWKKTDAFYGKPWVWNVFCNLSQKVNMGGDLKGIQENFQEAMSSKEAGQLKGMGMMMEGFGYNPVVREFVMEKSWKPQAVDVSSWLNSYVRRRYGISESAAEKAWALLLEGPYSRNLTDESVICTTPLLSRFKPSDINRFGVGYDATKVAEACGLMLQAAPKLKHRRTFRFDLVHVTREFLSNLARRFNSSVARAYKNRNIKALELHTARFLDLIRDMDTLLATNENFLLGKWLADARARGVDENEKDLYEKNARSLVTMWQPSLHSQLRDYASRQWSGLLKDFYLPRWQLFFRHMHRYLDADIAFSKRVFSRELKMQELEWINQSDPYPSKPQGDSIKTARRLFNKYIGYYNRSQD